MTSRDPHVRVSIIIWIPRDNVRGWPSAKLYFYRIYYPVCLTTYKVIVLSCGVSACQHGPSMYHDFTYICKSHLARSVIIACRRKAWADCLQTYDSASLCVQIIFYRAMSMQCLRRTRSPSSLLCRPFGFHLNGCHLDVITRSWSCICENICCGTCAPS